MVSTEANNTDWQAATRAFGDLPADARAAALGAVAWMQPTGFAQAAAVAYLHDAPAASPLTLASSHPATESAVSARDIAQIADEVRQRCHAAGVNPAEIDRLVAQINSNIGASRSSVEEIRGEALREADDLVAHASERAAELTETAEHENERLWGEIRKLNEEIVDTLSPHMTEEEKKREEEFKRKLEAATSDEERAQIMKDYNNFHEEVRERLEDGQSPAGRAAAATTKPKIEKVDEDLNNATLLLAAPPHKDEATSIPPTSIGNKISSNLPEKDVPLLTVAQEAKAAASLSLVGSLSDFDAMDILQPKAFPNAANPKSEAALIS